MHSFVRATLAMLPLGLAACATTVFDYKGQDAGYLVASLSLPTRSFGFETACLRYRPKGEATGGTVCFTQKPAALREDMKREHEITKLPDGDFLGGVVVRALPPGQYEIFSYVISQGQETFIRPNKPLSVPFTIKSGTPTYVGQYQWTLTMGPDALFGNQVVKGATVTVANWLARDMEKAAALRGIPKSAVSAVPVVRAQ